MFLFDKCHLEPPESNMSTPLNDFVFFRASQSLIANRLLRFRTFWSLLWPAGAFWGLLQALGAAWCFLMPPGTIWGFAAWSEHEGRHMTPKVQNATPCLAVYLAL
jgi:hypothetical protein